MRAYVKRMVKRALLFCLFCGGFSAPLFAQDGSAAYVFFQADDYQRAIQIAQNELITNPNNFDAQLVLSWGLLATGQNQRALSVASDAYERAPDDARLAAVIGESYYHLGRYLESLSFLERYISLISDGIALGRVHSFMGEIFIQFGEYNNASVALAAAVERDPSVSLWWQRLGFVYEQLSQKSDARTAYQRALELNPNAQGVQESLDRASQ